MGVLLLLRAQVSAQWASKQVSVDRQAYERYRHLHTCYLWVTNRFSSQVKMAGLPRKDHPGGISGYMYLTHHYCRWKVLPGVVVVVVDYSSVEGGVVVVVVKSK